MVKHHNITHKSARRSVKAKKSMRNKKNSRGGKHDMRRWTGKFKLMNNVQQTVDNYNMLNPGVYNVLNTNFITTQTNTPITMQTNTPITMQTNTTTQRNTTTQTNTPSLYVTWQKNNKYPSSKNRHIRYNKQ